MIEVDDEIAIERKFTWLKTKSKKKIQFDSSLLNSYKFIQYFRSSGFCSFCKTKGLQCRRTHLELDSFEPRFILVIIIGSGIILIE